MRKVAAVFTSFLVTWSCLAQVTAKQGDPNAPPKDGFHRFRSPMILEVPLYATDSSLWGVGDVTKDDLSKFVCDGVLIKEFAENVSEPRRGQIQIMFPMHLYAELGVDKRADLTIEVVRGDDQLATVSLREIKVGEGKVTVRHEPRVSISVDELRRTPTPTVRITLSARNDR